MRNIVCFPIQRTAQSYGLSIIRKCPNRVSFDKSVQNPKRLSSWAVSIHMHKLSLEPPECSPKCLYYTHNSYLFTYLCAPSGKWWSLETILACQILYQILQGHSGIQFVEQNKELLLIVLLFDQIAALHLCQSLYYGTHSPLTHLPGNLLLSVSLKVLHVT